MRFLRWFSKQYNWIIKSIQYAKFLKNDIDNDYASLLWLIQYKIGRMRLAIYKANLVESADQQVREMLVAEMMLQKIMDDEFLPELERAHTAKWGEHKLDFVKNKKGNTILDSYRVKAREQGREAEQKVEQLEIYRKQEVEVTRLKRFV